MTEEKTNPDFASEVSATHKPDEAPKITNTQKEKDPRKVAAGKKLGAISKMAKKQKKYKAEVHEAEALRNLNNNNSDYSTSPLAAGLAVVVVVGCLGALYWNSQKQQQPKPQEAPVKLHTSLARSNLISLDD